MDDSGLPSAETAWRIPVRNSTSVRRRRDLGKLAASSAARALAFAVGGGTGEAVEGRGPSQQEIIAHYARKRARASRISVRPRP